MSEAMDKATRCVFDRLDYLARRLRSSHPINPDTARFNERVAEGLRVTGDVIRWMRWGERPGEDVPVGRRARFGRLVEELGLARQDSGARLPGQQ